MPPRIRTTESTETNEILSLNPNFAAMHSNDVGNSSSGKLYGRSYDESIKREPNPPSPKPFIDDNITYIDDDDDDDEEVARPTNSLEAMQLQELNTIENKFIKSEVHNDSDTAPSPTTTASNGLAGERFLDFQKLARDFPEMKLDDLKQRCIDLGTWCNEINETGCRWSLDRLCNYSQLLTREKFQKSMLNVDGFFLLSYKLEFVIIFKAEELRHPKIGMRCDKLKFIYN
uniref:Uncharacterized protein n=1 Tax=Glossina pallidipes TaxID=7398 RepID=A0A1B0A5P8_GLOPL